MNDIYILIGTYLGILVGLLVLINVLTNGFLFTFLKVKASRGQKILIQIRGKLQHYFLAGVVEEGFLVYRDKAAKRDGRKSFKRVVIKGNPFYRSLNVNCINVDEELNCIIMPDNLKGVNGYDALKWNGLLVRALMKVKLSEEPIMVIITMIAAILSFLGIIYLAVQMNGLTEAISLLQQNTLITGGNLG